ncbi:MAG TPA: hypothetical protein VII94_01410 [Candidatus Saccharimonadales bacterium]
MCKYIVGTNLIHNESGIIGIVIENFKLPGDICVEWKTGFKTSYDEESLNENCSILE